VDDIKELTDLNHQFIDAFRKGSWEVLKPILAPSFRYLDGATGQVWDMPRYIEALRASPEPAIEIDQLAIHVDGDAAVVSARSVRPESSSRYVDSYLRSQNGWRCFHACVWPC
jgi:hypothetical protein